MGSHRRRLVGLLAAGLVDSLCLSTAWTVVVLQVAAVHGLAAVGACTAAMLVGVALSAPVAARLARALDGRGLLRTAAGVEAALRVAVFLLVLAGAPVWLLAVCVCAMNVMAWTGYAGMRAEVAAITTGATALTWYGTVVAAVEAVGVALAVLLPLTPGADVDGVLLAVMAAYVLALLPTVVLAGGSPVPRATAARPPAPRSPVEQPAGRRRRPTLPRVTAPVAVGSALVLVASGPTLLAVALAEELHGRPAVALAAAAFTVGSLASPAVAAVVERRGANRPLTWAACALLMVAGWVVAPLGVLALCAAQLLSGLSLTTLEGLLDATAARRSPGEVTGALARSTAARALGSAASTALLPLLVAQVGLRAGAGALTTGLLLAVAVLAVAATRRGRRPAAAPAPVEPPPAAGPIAALPAPRSTPEPVDPALPATPPVTAAHLP